MGAVRFGDYIAKVSVAPLSAEVRALTGQAYDPRHAPSIVRERISDFFASTARPASFARSSARTSTDAAYESSAAFRHAMNAQPRVEPRSIDEIPD
jgi:hypothetical protein